MSLWEAAAIDYEAMARERALTNSRVAASDHWRYLAGSASTEEYKARKALVAERLDAIVDRFAPSPADFAVIRASLEEGIDKDFRAYHHSAARQAQLRKQAEQQKQAEDYSQGFGRVEHSDPAPGGEDWQRARQMAQSQAPSATMTRQHYNHIAHAISTAPVDEETRNTLAHHFAGHLSGTNPNFNHDRFVGAATKTASKQAGGFTDFVKKHLNPLDSGETAAQSEKDNENDSGYDIEGSLKTADPLEGKQSGKVANQYISQQGDKWVITQKGTGKVLSHHDSEGQAEAAFRAMESNKHGGSRKTTAADDLRNPGPEDIHGHMVEKHAGEKAADFYSNRSEDQLRQIHDFDHRDPGTKASRDHGIGESHQAKVRTESSLRHTAADDQQGQQQDPSQAGDDWQGSRNEWGQNWSKMFRDKGWDPSQDVYQQTNAARRVAAQWHAGTGPLHRLATTGSLHPAVVDEADHLGGLQGATREDLAELYFLRTYAKERLRRHADAMTPTPANPFMPGSGGGDIGTADPAGGVAGAGSSSPSDTAGLPDQTVSDIGMNELPSSSKPAQVPSSTPDTTSTPVADPSSSTPAATQPQSTDGQVKGSFHPFIASNGNFVNATADNQSYTLTWVPSPNFHLAAGPPSPEPFDNPSAETDKEDPNPSNPPQGMEGAAGGEEGHPCRDCAAPLTWHQDAHGNQMDPRDWHDESDRVSGGGSSDAYAFQSATAGFRRRADELDDYFNNATKGPADTRASEDMKTNPLSNPGIGQSEPRPAAGPGLTNPPEEAPTTAAKSATGPSEVLHLDDGETGPDYSDPPYEGGKQVAWYKGKPAPDDQPSDAEKGGS